MMKKIILVGAGSSIGRELAIILLEAGHFIFGISRSASPLQHSNYSHLVYNIHDEDFPLSFLPESINGLVYLPGTINLKPLRGLKQSDFLEDYKINVLGAVKSIQACQPRFSIGSSIVLFSTVAVQRGMPFHASIASAKGAIEGLTRSLAAEFAPKIRVNAIAPSLTETPLAERLINNETKLQASRDRHPLKEIGTPEDMAQMAAFLLSDNAKWITGQVMKVDGGLSVI
jgi:NAD(P)-dependent dehydrogenase (short-subunit alcohol dehydrogenase family)